MNKLSGLLGALTACTLLFSHAATAQISVVNTGKLESADEGDEEGGDGGGTADRRMYVSPMASYTFADGDRATDDGIGAAISLGKRFTSGLNLELTGFYTRYDLKGPTTGTNTEEAELTGLGAAAMIFWSQALPNLYTVFALHHGQSENHPTTPASTGFSYKTTVFDPGVGYLLPLEQWLGGFEMSLRAEARYRMDAHTRTTAGSGGKKDFYEGVVNLGVFIPLGKLPVQETASDVEVVEPTGGTDSDGDGVADDVDQCPDTAAGASVNEQGCESDSDADGVIDRLDSCPDTAAGSAVNEQGCSVGADADNDGVQDDKDQCPATAAGTPVDENGCEVKAQDTGCRAPAPGEPIDLEGCATGESIVLKGVNFEVNSSRLTANARVILNQVADSLAAKPNLKVEIGGHTDSQGSDAFNQKLSERRAQAVYDYLVARGIDSTRLSVKGYGESQPIDSNETPEGRELNRRVELKVLEGGNQ